MPPRYPLSLLRPSRAFPRLNLDRPRGQARDIRTRESQRRESRSRSPTMPTLAVPLPASAQRASYWALFVVDVLASAPGTPVRHLSSLEAITLRQPHKPRPAQPVTIHPPTRRQPLVGVVQLPITQHQVVKPRKLVNTAVGMLEQELLVPNLFQEQGVDQFKGAENDTISMKVEGILPFHDYAWRNDRWNPIVFDENAGRTIAVTFGGNVYSAVKLTVCRGLERRPAVVRGGFSPTRHTAAPPAGSRPERSVSLSPPRRASRDAGTTAAGRWSSGKSPSTDGACVPPEADAAAS